MKKRQRMGRFVRSVISKAPGIGRLASRANVSSGTAATGDVGPDGPIRRIEYNDGTDIMATDDLAVLVGMVGLKLGLEPRGRPLIVNHWATWCDGCVQELPNLVTLRAQTRDTADFVGVGWEGFSGGGGPSDWIMRVDEVSRKNALSWSTMVFEGAAQELFENFDFEVQTIPQTWVYSAEGTLVFRQQGEITKPNIDQILTAIGVSK